MRLGIIVLLSLLSATVGSGGPGSLTPPRCSQADTSHQKALVVPSTGTPVHLRFCGPAHIQFSVNGRAYRVEGGRCVRDRRGLPHERAGTRRLAGIDIGLITNRPKPPGLGVSIWWTPVITTGGGRSRVYDSEIEVPGRRVAASGTVVAGKNLNGGSFTLYGRTADGPTGDDVTGTWKCGERL